MAATDEPRPSSSTWSRWIPVTSLAVTLAVLAMSFSSRAGGLEVQLETVQNEVKIIREADFAKRLDIVAMESRLTLALASAEERLMSRMDRDSSVPGRPKRR